VHQQAAAWAEGAVDLVEHLPVLIDVLEHVETADDIPLPVVGKRARVGLDQLGIRYAARGDLDALGEELHAAEAHLRERVSETREDEPVAAADLEETPGRGEVLPQHRDDQAVSRPVPEALGLDPGQLGEVPALVRRTIQGSGASRTASITRSCWAAESVR